MGGPQYPPGSGSLPLLECTREMEVCQTKLPLGAATRAICVINTIINMSRAINNAINPCSLVLCGRVPFTCARGLFVMQYLLRVMWVICARQGELVDALMRHPGSTYVALSQPLTPHPRLGRDSLSLTKDMIFKSRSTFSLIFHLCIYNYSKPQMNEISVLTCSKSYLVSL